MIAVWPKLIRLHGRGYGRHGVVWEAEKVVMSPALYVLIAVVPRHLRGGGKIGGVKVVGTKTGQETRPAREGGGEGRRLGACGVREPAAEYHRDHYRLCSDFVPQCPRDQRVGQGIATWGGGGVLCLCSQDGRRK